MATNGTNEALTLSGSSEKTMVRPAGSTRHIHYTIGVADAPRGKRERDPVSLALVIDRSGSMSGAKLETAKKAALAVLDHLDERDTASITVFDTDVETVLPAVRVTGENRDRARRELSRIEARATTALHEGWLTGCRTIASRQPLDTGGHTARCFLLTDGLANVGEKDPERIAEEAAGIRRNAGIGTSTFGIGDDYDEGLLRPLAVAGGGQFHHLRREEEIANTFSGELGEIMSVAARRVTLELAVSGEAAVDMVSEYRSVQDPQGGVSADIGDLMGGEVRHVVIRVRTRGQAIAGRVTLRARVRWMDEGGARETEWREVTFTVASDAVCAAEPRDPAVLHWVGVHHSTRAQRLAMEAEREGDSAKAVTVLDAAIRRLDRYARGDTDLETALEALRSLRTAIQERKLTMAGRKEVLYSSHIASRGQRDHRGRA